MNSTDDTSRGARPMVLLHTAYGLPEAELIRSILTAAGIRVELNSAGAGVAYGLTVGPLARVEIFVPAARTAEAQALIAQLAADEADTTSATDTPEPSTPAD